MSLASINLDWRHQCPSVMSTLQDGLVVMAVLALMNGVLTCNRSLQVVSRRLACGSLEIAFATCSCNAPWVVVQVTNTALMLAGSSQRNAQENGSATSAKIFGLTICSRSRPENKKTIWMECLFDGKNSSVSIVKKSETMLGSMSLQSNGTLPTPTIYIYTSRVPDASMYLQRVAAGLKLLAA